MGTRYPTELCDRMRGHYVRDCAPMHNEDDDFRDREMLFRILEGSRTTETDFHLIRFLSWRLHYEYTEAGGKIPINLGPIGGYGGPPFSHPSYNSCEVAQEWANEHYRIFRDLLDHIAENPVG